MGIWGGGIRAYLRPYDGGYFRPYDGDVELLRDPDPNVRRYLGLEADKKTLGRLIVRLKQIQEAMAGIGTPH